MNIEKEKQFLEIIEKDILQKHGEGVRLKENVANIYKKLMLKKSIERCVGSLMVTDQSMMVGLLVGLAEFINEELDKREKNVDANYYVCIDHLDDILALLKIALSMPKDFDYKSTQNYPIEEENSMTPEEIKEFLE